MRSAIILANRPGLKKKLKIFTPVYRRDSELGMHALKCLNVQNKYVSIQKYTSMKKPHKKC